MALQSSGAISLNDAHVEVGSTSGTTVALNDADIRGLIGKASGAQFGLSELYGASSVVGWVYVMVQPGGGGAMNFGDLTINSNNDYFVLHEYTTTSSGRSVEGSTSNMELWKMNSDGAVSTRKGYSLGHISSTYHKNIRLSQNSPWTGSPKLILRGTTDLYHYYLRTSFQVFNQINYQFFTANIGMLVKNNQSDLNPEDKRWHHAYINGRPRYYWGNVNSGISSMNYNGYQHEALYSGVFLDNNNKMVVDQAYKSASEGCIATYRYPVDSSYNTAPEICVKTRFQPANSSYWSYNQNTWRIWGYGHSTSQNWRIVENDKSYAIYKDNATRSQSASSTGYSTYVGTGVSNSYIRRQSTYSYPRYACADGNGHPAVFGYGGGYSENGTRHNGAFWCQKHTSTGGLGNRFSFSPSNPTSSSYADGGFWTGVFDSSDNCYMAGYSTMNRNVDGMWNARGNYFYNYPTITTICKFNSSGVYQWHRFIDTKEYYEHFVNGGSSSAFTSTYGAYVLYSFPMVNAMRIDNNGDLVLCGGIRFYGGNTNSYAAPYILKLPTDGAIPNGFHGVQSTVNGASRNVGVYLGEFGGDGQSSTSQFYWANQSTGNIFSNNQYEESSPTMHIVEGHPRNSASNNGTSYNTTSLPCAFNTNGGFGGGFTVSRSQSDANGNFLPYTAPTEHSGTGKADF